MTIEIAVSATSFCKNEDLKGLLIKRFPKAVITFANPQKEDLKDKALIEFFQGKEYAIVGKEKISEDLLSQLPSLKGISKYGVGIDNIDFEACKKFGVKVYYEKGVNKQAAAEHALSLMLCLSRKICQGDRLMRRGIWRKDGGQTLYNKTVGIIGCGHIGGQIANLLKALGCQILLRDIVDVTELAKKVGGKCLDLNSLLKKSDVVTLHVPLTDLTFKMIGEKELDLMKNEAFIINTSRGEVIDQESLKKALKCRSIAGAGLDVFESEPLSDAELSSLENIICTPHTAGNAKEAVLAMGKAAIRGLESFDIANVSSSDIS